MAFREDRTVRTMDIEKRDLAQRLLLLTRLEAEYFGPGRIDEGHIPAGVETGNPLRYRVQQKSPFIIQLFNLFHIPLLLRNIIGDAVDAGDLVIHNNRQQGQA
ncbi:hypothetical protein D3C76_1629150 [compost metagenome]